MTFRKKPVTVEAIQWTGVNTDEVLAFCMAKASVRRPDVRAGEPGWKDLIIETLEGNMRASVNDWIICGTRGEFYPCKPDVFADVYEKAS